MKNKILGKVLVMILASTMVVPALSQTIPTEGNETVDEKPVETELNSESFEASEDEILGQSSDAILAKYVNKEVLDTWTFGTEVKLEENVTIDQSIQMVNGKVDLNGKVLTVNGDFNVRAGQLIINGGALIVNGNFNVADYNKDRDTYDYVRDKNREWYYYNLQMINPNDSITVSGDVHLLGNTLAYGNSAASSPNSSITDGCLSIGGDFYTDSNSRDFAPYIAVNSNTVKFTGKNKVHKYFNGSDVSKFANLYVEDGGSLEVTGGTLCIAKLQSDLTINLSGDLTVQDIQQNGHNITINTNGKKLIVCTKVYNGGNWGSIYNSWNPQYGYAEINGDLELIESKSGSGIFLEGASQMKITGSLYHIGDGLQLRGGSIEIGKDYINAVYNEKTNTYSDGTGYLVMSKTSSQMKVAGDFRMQSSIRAGWSESVGLSWLYAGTIYIGGNFYEVAGDKCNFNGAYGSTHKVVMNGTGPKTISFSGTDSKFNILELKQETKYYTITPDNCWNQLIEVSAPTPTPTPTPTPSATPTLAPTATPTPAVNPGKEDVTKTFKDVSPNKWYAMESGSKPIQYVIDKGLMQGTTTTTFKPEENCSRTMMVQILYNSEGRPAASGSNTFSDVENKWYYQAVIWASVNKVTTGYSDGRFGVNDNVTRQQMAKFLMNFAAFKGYDTSSRADLGQYQDASLIAGWALDAMKWANANGIINGKSTTKIDPNGYATRAEVAQMIMNFQEKFGK